MSFLPADSFTSVRIVLASVALSLSGLASPFPLPVPTRPTVFPLVRPARLGTVVAWGDDNVGQSTVPASLSGVVVAVDAGTDHTAALKSDGTVVAWGANNHGQSIVPPGLSGVVAIDAGGDHTVALKNDGKVVSWGAWVSRSPSIPGELTTPGYLETLEQPLGRDWVAIAAGNDHTVGLKSDGTVSAWDRNIEGQTSVPAGLNSVVAIAAGSRSRHTVALKAYYSPGPRRATAAAQMVNGFIVGLGVVDGGEGYTGSPKVIISGGGGSGATATASVSGGIVTGFVITNPGRDYTSLPTVRIGSPEFAAQLSIEVSRVNVNLKVVLGKKYQLETSNDLAVWAKSRSDFVAQEENITQEFVVSEVGTYFRILEVP